MAAHSSILVWKIPWTVEPGRLLSMGSQRVGHTERREEEDRVGLNWSPKWWLKMGTMKGEQSGDDEGRIKRVYMHFEMVVEIVSNKLIIMNEGLWQAPPCTPVGTLVEGVTMWLFLEISVSFPKSATIFRQQRRIYPRSSESFGEQRKPCILASAYPLLHFQCSCLTQQLEHLHWKIPKTVVLKQKKQDICNWIVLDGPKLWCT